jgi:hypothetical protein
MAAPIVDFHRLAAREYRLARQWYARRSNRAGARFRLNVEHCLQRISKNAESLPTLIAPYRYVRVGRFPYLLIFRPVAPLSVVVIALAHTSRREGYWHRRK